LGSLLGTSDLDDSFWEILEASLIQADAGSDVALAIVEDLRKQAAANGWQERQETLEALRKSLEARVDLAPPSAASDDRPQVTLLVGVNGSGKTTSAAKLAHRLALDGQEVLLAAADTYRAAGAEQLERWATRLDLPVVRGDEGGDSAAVVYQAIQQAQRQSIDTVIVDTSGRMHTSHNLMAELEKIGRVAGKAMPGAPHRTLIVLDATTGQNALAQAEGFSKAVPADGIILAKLDSSAKGGIGLAVVERLRLPIIYVGLGEGAEDLVAFDPEAYVDGLLADVTAHPIQEESSARQEARPGG
jgi:fused signal recognition particle receptor